VSGAKRLPNLPQVQAITETFPGCILEAWYAVIGPKGMPADIVQKLNQAITTIVQSDSFTAQIAAEGAAPAPSTPDALLAFMKSEYAKHGSLVSRSGAVIQ
jgi:tripartite-type tricarboxylate transporter receptor subunit TctC